MTADSGELCVMPPDATTSVYLRVKVRVRVRVSWKVEPRGEWEQKRE
jgi:hypothetical protein